MDGPKSEGRQTASIEVAILVDDIAGRAQLVAKKLEEKTRLFCEESFPQPEAKDAKAVRALPPYFGDLRSTLWSIDHSLSAIENIISRMDI